MLIKQPCVYILASQRNGTLYVGVTSDIIQRVWRHRSDAIDGFSKRYKVHLLVHVEFHSSIVGAIPREKQLKVWRRVWKLRLIEENNTRWRDFYADFVLGTGPSPSRG